MGTSINIHEVVDITEEKTDRHESEGMIYFTKRINIMTKTSKTAIILFSDSIPALVIGRG